MFKKKPGKNIVSGDIVRFSDNSLDLVLRIEQQDQAHYWCDGLTLENGEIDFYSLAAEHEYSVLSHS